MIHLKLGQFKRLAATMRAKPLDLADDGGLKEVQAILNDLSSQGITTSICYGPTRKDGICFSVDVFTQDQQSFGAPYAASSLKQAVHIARVECIHRGWLKTKKRG